MNELEKIQANAEMVVQQMRPISGLAFDYDAESIEWLDGYINRLRARGGIDDTLVSVFGSYLGECVRRCHGGEWKYGAHGWEIAFNEKNGVFPFSKVRKQVENGEEDSIYSFFMSIPIMFGISVPSEERKKPWWWLW